MRSIILISVLTCAVSSAISQQKLSNVVTIPVVVHVVYNNALQNISDEQVRSQIRVLNEDYRRKNADAAHIPAAFQAFAADAGLEFQLATADPSGMPTSGIVRKITSETSFTTDDKVKHSVTGGDDGWNRDQYLNLWVCNLSGGILGYASAPGAAPEKDGVVIRYNVFGNTGTAQAPFNRGRTATHEVGHWLGLRHIWGDSPCGDDKIADTPPQSGPTRGCPSGVVSTCSSGAAGNMYMDFMDFTDDACLSMFTAGQVTRIHELFASGAARYALLSSDKAVGTTSLAAVIADPAKVTLYPNPAVNEVKIAFDEDVVMTGKQLLIYNHLGQAVRTVTVTRREFSINLTGLPSGVYFVSCGGVSKKFLKAD